MDPWITLPHPAEGRGRGAHLAIETLREYNTEYVTHSRCDAQTYGYLPSQENTASANCLILISHKSAGKKLSWPEWLASDEDGMPVNGSPIPVLTGLDVDQLR